MENTRAFWCQTKRWPVLIPFLVALWFFGPSLVFKYIWLDLQAVHVTDAASALSARVDVTRRTVLGGFIRYRVAFRSAADHFHICEAGAAPFKYKPGLSNPITGKSLGWWAGGSENAAFRSCIADGLHDGRFYAVTCHTALLSEILPIPIATRCRASNVFALGGDGHLPGGV